jgi:hypothetical protein
MEDDIAVVGAYEESGSPEGRSRQSHSFYNNSPSLSTRNMLLQLGPMAHACNPSYSGVRGQEDHGLKPAWANSSQDCLPEKTHHKKGLVECLKVKALRSNPSSIKKKSDL